MKKHLFIVLLNVLLIPLLFLCGCKDKAKDPNYISNYLKSLTSYTCDGEIIVKNSKGNYIYATSQVYLNSKGFRLELGKERIYMYLDDKIYVKDLNNNSNYIMSNSMEGIFKLSLINQYMDLLYTNENVKYEYKNIDSQDYQVIELIIPGNNRDMSKAHLYVNVKTMSPNKLCIFNYKNEETVQVNYSNFNANAEIDKSLFDVN